MRVPRPISERGEPFARIFRNPALRRAELAWGAFYTGEWAYVVALSIYAYEDGGAVGVGLVGLLRMLPAALVAPFGALLADRYRRERVLVLVHASRTLLIGATAAAALSPVPSGVVYGLAVLASVSSAAFRPAQWALLPALARTPAELTAANAASSTIESLATLVGPLVGGVLAATAGTETVFAVAAALFLAAALLVARIEAPAIRPAPAGDARGLADEALAGLRALRAYPGPRLVIGLFGAQTLVRGALNVLVVVLALDLLAIGETGVGFLNSAFGLGGLVGGVAAVALAGRRRLALPFALSLVLWGAPLALAGAVPETAVALLAIALVGAGNSVLDVAGLTLVQRLVPDDVLARVFGVLETMALAAVGVGAVLTPLLIETAGIRTALAVTGALLPLLALLTWPRLRRVDEEGAPSDAVGLLRAIPLFAPLAPATVEALASRLAPRSFRAGEVVIREGDAGDRFYVVAAGEAVAAASDRVMGPGDHFGEIALLRDVPRTTTVTARTDLELLSLERDEFVGAVTGHPQSLEAADAVVSARLGALRSRVSVA